VVRLVQSAPHMRRLRALVAKGSMNAPLFDSRAHTAEIERAFVLHAPVGRQGSAGHGAALAVLEWCGA
jgi:hypothetical protein